MPSVRSLLTLGGILYAASAAADDLTEDLPAGVLHFPLIRERTASSELVKRKDDYFEGTSYFSLYSEFRFVAQLEIGKNKQIVSAQIDTGSSDLWVMDWDNPYCDPIVNGTSTIKPHKKNNKKVNANWKAECYVTSMIDPKKASFKKNKTSFSIVNHGSLIDGYTFVNGTYGHDDVSFAGQTIKDANFVLAENTNASIAVWGIGLPGGENLVNHVDSKGVYSPTYSNLPMQMKEQGLIKANAYSLWLNQTSFFANGTLLFGGIDHSKYSGTLQTVPIVSSRPGISNPDTLQIMLHGISLEQGSNHSQIIQCATPAKLDTMAEYIMLPDEFLSAIQASLGASFSQEGLIPVPCDVQGSLQFDFSGITIDIPLSNMTESTFLNKVTTCTLNLRTGGDSVILGHDFLEWVYTVFDLDNKEIALAPSVQNATKSSFEAISSSIPSATQASSYSSTSIQNSISTTHATFFSNAMTAENSASSSALVYSDMSTSQAPTAAYTGVSSERPLKSGTADKKDRKGNAAPSIQRQSVLGTLLTSIAGLFLTL